MDLRKMGGSTVKERVYVERTIRSGSDGLDSHAHFCSLNVIQLTSMFLILTVATLCLIFKYS